MFVVYCHTCKVSGKRYVGWTSMTLEQRWKIHCNRALKGSKLHFHNAIRCHGKSDDVWIHEILEECSTKEDARDRAEPLWIRQLEAFGPKGYNMTSGGDGAPDVKPMLGRKHSEDARRKMSESHRRRAPETIETRKRKAEAQRIKWANPAYREMMSAAHRRSTAL